MLKRNLRINDRKPVALAVKLRWQGTAGEAHFARGKILNCSDGGVCFELSEPIQPRCYVSFDAPELDRAEWGTGGAVRYCSSKGAKYIVGLELSVAAKRT